MTERSEVHVTVDGSARSGEPVTGVLDAGESWTFRDDRGSHQ